MASSIALHRVCAGSQILTIRRPLNACMFSPAHTIPSGGKPSPGRMERIQEGHERIEAAFQKYFHRADEIDMPDDAYFKGDPKEADAKKSASEVPPDPSSKHEYEIIVCHANLIRYFMCRSVVLLLYDVS